MGLDLEAFFTDYLKGGGYRFTISGPTGAGKTRTTVSFIQMLEEGWFPSLGRVETLTNIVFSTRAKDGSLAIGHPPGVHYVTTFADVMRKIGEILTKYGMGEVTILLVLDEAQNFMLADLNGAEENQALLKFMGNIRKFRMCTLFLTPTIKNLVPKIRNFDTDKEPGYTNVRITKHKIEAKHLVERSGQSINYEHITWIQVSPDVDPAPFSIPYTSWANTREDDLKPGQFAYDTLSAADFSLGHNRYGVKFNLKDFLSFISKGRSKEIPAAIEAYFKAWDLLGAEEEVAQELQEAHVLHRMREVNLTWSQMSYIFGVSESTLRSRHNKFFPSDVSQKSDTASKKAKREIDPSAGRVYIQPKGGDVEGEKPLPEANSGSGGSIQGVKMDDTSNSNEGVIEV